jgi:ubiquitin-protein ligase
MIKASLIAKKRIQKDLVEIKAHPIEGISIAPISPDDIYKYVVNIKLMNNIYKGYCLHLLLTFNENYPTKPHKILIYPQQEFDNRYHHHVFADINGYKKFCFDLLDNNFLNTDIEHSGWNPSYSISSLLLQVRLFLSDMYDLDEKPSEEKIKYLLNSMKNYKRQFIDLNGNEVIHTWDNPYPEFPDMKDSEKSKSTNEVDKKKYMK